VYTNLSDASASVFDKRYGTGRAKVWYAKPRFSRESFMGVAWMKANGTLPTPATIAENYICVGALDTESPEAAFHMMQGCIWSPNGEARAFIDSLGLEHTSMSVGDIFEVNGRFFVTDRVGFVKLEV
jgi:hypothetical protein